MQYNESLPMTTKERLKNSLMGVLDRYPADSITVKLFCLESGLSKQTLYNHYYSLMDAFEDAYRCDLEQGLKGCDTYENWVQGFRQLLHVLKRHERAYIHIFHSSRKEDFLDIIAKYGEKLVLRGIEECSEDMGLPVSPRDREFMLLFYMSAFMGILEHYLEGGMSESTDYIAGRCDALMRHHIRGTLRNIKAIEEGEF